MRNFDGTAARRRAQAYYTWLRELREFAARGDFETATYMEARLHRDVLKAIAEDYAERRFSSSDHCRLAALALTSREVEFPRTGE